MSGFACVASTADVCGEGAVWHAEQSAVYWTDINRGLVHRMLHSGGAVQTWRFDQPATALALTTDPDRLLLVLAGRIVLWSPAHGELDRLHTLREWPLLRCNDARVSPCGSLWFGTMQNNVAADGTPLAVTDSLGAVHSLSGTGQVRDWDTGFGIGNTVCWSLDGTALLFGDTLANRIYRYAYDAVRDSVDVARRTVFCEGFARGLPDGSALDAEGFLWNCRYAGGCVVRFAPDGSVERVVDTPVPNPTTCAFGGPELRELYVTSARQSAPTAAENDGGLFRATLPVRGLALPRFRLGNT